MGIIVHRLRALIARSEQTAFEKSKSNQVYLVQWQTGEEAGSAWVQTKAQLDTIVSILRSKPGMSATAETYLIPRDKGGLVGFLNLHAKGKAKPTAVLRIANE